MRRVAFGLLVATALGGCNQIFGLDETTALPDAPAVIQIDAAWPSIQLGFLQLTFDPAAPVPPPVLAPFPDLMRLDVGTLDGTLVARTPDATGTVTIPPDITMAGPFRLVYQRTGDPVVHEFQGLLGDARVVEPLFGPITRPAIPVGAGWHIAPTNAPTNHTTNRVFTVGTWTDGSTTVFGAGMPTLDYDYQAGSTSSMSGPLGAPAATDRGVLVDYDPLASNCPLRAIGSTDFPAGNPGPPRPTVVGAWTQFDTVARTSTTPLAIQFPAHIHPFGEDSPSQREHYGFIPSDAMPAFTRGPDLIGRRFALRNPVMFSLRVCTAVDSPSLNHEVHDPILFKDKFDRALYTEVTVERTITGGAIITNGVGVLTLGVTGFQVDTNVAFAKNAKVETPSGTIDLWAADGVTLPLGGTLTLTWDAAVATQTADFWEVTVKTVSGFAVMPKRIYTTTKREVKIQSTDLSPGTQYILEISGFIGRPDASTKADFGRVSGNQSMSVLNTRTFVTQ